MDLPWAEPFTLLMGEIEFFLSSMELDSMPETSLDAKLELEKIQYFEKRAHGLLDLGDDDFQQRVVAIIVIQYNDTNPHLSRSQLQVFDASINNPGTYESQHSLVRSTHIQQKYEKNPRHRPVRGQFDLSEETVTVWMNLGNPISIGDITNNPNPSWLDLKYWDEPMYLSEMNEKENENENEKKREKGGFYMAWPGYTHGVGTQFHLGKNLTRKGFLVKIANLVKNFCDAKAHEICENARWKIGAGNLKLNDIYLFGVRRVSCAGFEPILLVRKQD
ncbi:hypothetical protein B0H21DRAFT_718144 [Amylocystis lapponica]|nr:hypothetical protein B0H21DRAFT_718144 [Amylocystis lapponica]